MIRAVTVTNYLGESKRFELAFPEKSGFAVQSISGLGPSKADINTTEISTNDGSLYNSARVNSRNIVMSLKLMFNPQIEDTRQDSYRNIPESKLTGEKWMEKSVNIGDQLSQVIGIYYPYRIDNYVKYVRSQKFYGRYMDDWYIMNPSKEELLDLLDHIHQIAEEYGIHINRKKTRIVKISSTYKFLQIKYSLTDSGKVIKRINPKRVTAMRRKLKRLAVKVKNEEISYENVENMFRSWMGGFYKLLSKEQRKNLIGLYEDLFEKSIEIVNKKMIIVDKTR